MRFQWSVQKSIKIKAIPFIIKELYERGDGANLEDLEQEFEIEYKSISVATTAKKQRPFWRTINFIRDDLKLLDSDNKFKYHLESTNDTDVIELIYNQAKENLIPFKVLLEIFNDFGPGIKLWEDMRRTLSAKMVELAKSSFPDAYAKKDKSSEWGIAYWEMDDPSVNRLVELFRMLGICSFLVVKHIRFIGNFNKEEKIRTIDFEELIGYLKIHVANFGVNTLITIDEIFKIVNRKGISFGVLEDAILSKTGAIQFFSGRENEELFVTQSNKEYYRLRFNEKAFE